MGPYCPAQCCYQSRKQHSPSGLCMTYTVASPWQFLWQKDSFLWACFQSYPEHAINTLLNNSIWYIKSTGGHQNILSAVTRGSQAFSKQGPSLPATLQPIHQECSSFCSDWAWTTCSQGLEFSRVLDIQKCWTMTTSPAVIHADAPPPLYPLEYKRTFSQKKQGFQVWVYSQFFTQPIQIIVLSSCSPVTVCLAVPADSHNCTDYADKQGSPPLMVTRFLKLCLPDTDPPQLKVSIKVRCGGFHM